MNKKDIATLVEKILFPRKQHGNKRGAHSNQ